MAGHSVCPWWIGWFLASPLRRFLQDPAAIVAPYVHAGMMVLEPGPGMGFFTLELARLVGPSGRVIAVDVQPQMIAGLQRRARRAGLAERIDARVVPPGSMQLGDVKGAVDFVFACAVVHEMPAPGPFFVEAAAALAPGGSLLLAEPAGHDDEAELAGELAAAAEAGLAVVSRPSLRKFSAVLMQKSAA
jgi:SAM-dependent methyltransferase